MVQSSEKSAQARRRPCAGSCPRPRAAGHKLAPRSRSRTRERQRVVPLAYADILKASVHANSTAHKSDIVNDRPLSSDTRVRDTVVERVRRLDEQGQAGEPGTAGRFGDHDLNAAPVPPRPLRPAAVLVPLVERPGGHTVLLTQRTEHLHDHAGQISFPGGRVEPDDAGIVDTALRETREEIGLASEYIDVVGYLDTYETVTGYLITPVVSFVTPGFRLRIDHIEVADAFEVPLEFILDPKNHQIHSRMRHGARRRYYVFEYRDRYIWGATAGMLMNLYRRLCRPATSP